MSDVNDLDNSDARDGECGWEQSKVTQGQGRSSNFNVRVRPGVVQA
jgi:hypothetical protein